MSVNLNIVIMNVDLNKEFKHGYVYSSNSNNLYLALTRVPFALNVPNGGVLLLSLNNSDLNLYFESSENVAAHVYSYTEIGPLNVNIERQLINSR
jgi:hypothetical protein